MKHLILDFLRQLPAQHEGIDAIILFGSIVSSEIYRDVDAILVFRNPGDVRATRGISRAFRKQFSTNLHTQLFFSSDLINLRAFLTAAHKWELVYGQGFASEHTFIFSRPDERT